MCAYTTLTPCDQPKLPSRSTYRQQSTHCAHQWMIDLSICKRDGNCRAAQPFREGKHPAQHTVCIVDARARWSTHQIADDRFSPVAKSHPPIHTQVAGLGSRRCQVARFCPQVREDDQRHVLGGDRQERADGLHRQGPAAERQSVGAAQDARLL